jgi:hypothetical protein
MTPCIHPCAHVLAEVDVYQTQSEEERHGGQQGGAGRCQTDDHPSGCEAHVDSVTSGQIDALRAQAACSVERASIVLGIGRSTAYAAARDGSLPTIRVSHRLLVPTAKLLVMLGYEE